MSKFKLILILLSVALICGIFLLGKGITGMVTESDDPFLKPVCSTNTDCNSGEVCCLFYESDSGACNSVDACSGILSLTKAEKEGVQTNVVEMPSQEDFKKQNMGEIILGAIIFVSTLILFSYYVSKENKTVKNKI